MSDDTLIRVEGLTRWYGERLAVDGVGFELRRGQVLGFLGPNGAGKSTTMQMITGNLAPSAGRVEISGIDLLERPREAKARLGYLPETPPLYRELTVDEYLTHCARLRRLPRRRIREAVARARERCGLADVGRRLIGNLSKGYRQRVGIAQAILHEPDVVILDEPTVGLDPIQIIEIRRLIGELGRDHSVILSTHILAEVQSICTHVQIIRDGRLVYAAAMAELGERAAARTLRVRLRRPPAEQELAALPGVASVEPLGPDRLRLVFADGAAETAAEALVERAAAGGWGLVELVPERKSLEEVFVELTTGDAAEPGRAAA
ncbi:ATP-binding cassette domain-containing protein [Inmirania thermothiophila]|uniref:ABC-2 type transport system ATP-binding protein n=1 Tax=Inmirania thermothiophila TaxID=1750597 RepID=A0A3N1Y6W8_9GAMM|nr:ATP-binding cassette domain-containing protein [Inmirania thermothiophila]ROR34271.1 ABC-2 type transport system ATP-binding protein [Inmirania thermothiophila]